MRLILRECDMLTEADMVRIMAAKYRLAESIVEENFSNESLDMLSGEDSYEESGYEMQDSSDFSDDMLFERREC